MFCVLVPKDGFFKNPDTNSNQGIKKRNRDISDYPTLVIAFVTQNA